MVACRKCGRALKNPVSIQRGIGPTCLRKEFLKKEFGSISKTLIHYPQLIRLIQIEEEEEKQDDNKIRSPELPIPQEN